jgi:hypothetical protein
MERLTLERSLARTLVDCLQRRHQETPEDERLEAAADAADDAMRILEDIAGEPGTQDAGELLVAAVG